MKKTGLGAPEAQETISTRKQRELIRRKLGMKKTREKEARMNGVRRVREVQMTGEHGHRHQLLHQDGHRHPAERTSLPAGCLEISGKTAERANLQVDCSEAWAVQAEAATERTEEATEAEADHREMDHQEADRQEMDHQEVAAAAAEALEANAEDVEEQTVAAITAMEMEIPTITIWKNLQQLWQGAFNEATKGAEGLSCHYSPQLQEKTGSSGKTIS